MNTFRKRVRIVGLAVVLGLAASLASAAAVPKASGVTPSSGFRKIAATPVGVRPARSIACTTAGTNCNTTVSGALTSDDCRLSFDNSFYDAWTFQVSAGQSVQITMRSTVFDTYLILFDPSGNEVDENNDGPGQGTDARISFTATDAGTYTVYANSYLTGITGGYTLEVVCGQTSTTCTAGPTTLCLNNGRFRVQAIFTAPTLGITNGTAQAVPLTTDTGYFWFFSSNNVEIVIKAVDGRPVNGFFWVFYGALSDVEYTITVTDTATGAVKPYHNVQGHLASVADTAAFPGSNAVMGASSAPEPAPTGPEMDEMVRQQRADVAALLTPSSAQACTPNGTTLCLNSGRFQVRAIFTAPTLGITNGTAQAVPLTTDTGYFWFFSSNNVEIVIKAVDGRPVNGFYWVFYGALSDVEYTITVTDTVTGVVKPYSNMQGHLASVADTSAFHP